MKKGMIVFLYVGFILLSSVLFAQQESTKPGTRVGDVLLGYNKFDAKTLGGNKITTKDFKGKHVFIDVWATWCNPCTMEFPFLGRVEKKFVGAKFIMFGISFDNDLDKIAPFKRKYGVTYPNIADGKGWKSPWANKYGIRSIPTNFLLDPEGKIISKNLRGWDVEYEVAKALGVESAIVYIFDADDILDDTEDDKRFDKAKAKVEKALKLEPDNPDVYLTMGNIFLDEGDNVKAREWYEKAVKNLDNSIDQFLIYRLYESIADSYAKEGNWEAVIAQYDKLIEKVEGPTKVSVKAALIKVLNENGRKKEGLEQRKILLTIFDKQDERFKKRYAGFRNMVEEEIDKMEKELKGKGE